MRANPARFEAFASPALRAWLAVPAHAARLTLAIATAAGDLAGDIPWNVAVAAHSGTSHTPERRAQQVIADYVSHLTSTREMLAEKGAPASAFEGYRAGYRQKYLAWLASRSGIYSSMIAGGSNFPVARMEKKNATEHARLTELLDWGPKAVAAILRDLHKQEVADTGGVIGNLEREIAKRKADQETYKAINKIAKRKKGTDAEKVAEIVAATGFSEATARKTITPGDFGDVGLPAYMLTNNLAQIKRLEERLQSETSRAQVVEADYPFDGGTVSYAVEDERLRIVFDTKPDEALRGQLRGAGFVYSPTNSAWQRKLTGNAVYAARRILNAPALPAIRD